MPSMDKVSGEEFRGDDGVGGRESGIMERHSDATRMVRPCVILEEGGGVVTLCVCVCGVGVCAWSWIVVDCVVQFGLFYTYWLVCRTANR